MPETLAEAYVKVGYQDLKNLDRQVDSTGQKFVRQFDQMESKSKRLTSAITVVGGALTAIGVAKFGNDVIGAATKMDSLNRMLVNVEGSQSAANKRFAEFTKLAKEPVLDPFNLSKYYTALKSVNVESKLSIDFMKNIANAMAGVGASNQQFALAMEQVVQMAGKGKVMGDDLRAIANSFPQIRKYLVEAFGTAIPEDLAKKGLNATQVLTGLNEVMAKAPKFAGGAQAAQDNFKQSLELFEATLGKNVLPTVTKFLDKLTNMMDSFQKLDPAIQKLIGGGAVTGGGLLGISAALGLIYKGIEPVVTGLKGLAATKVATDVGGAVAGTGIRAASDWAGVGIASGAKAGAGAFTALGMTIPQLAVATLVVTGTAYLGSKLLGEMAGGRPSTYIPSGEYVAASGKGLSAYQPLQQKAFKDLQALQMQAGNFPNKTIAEINPAGSQAVEGIIEAFNMDYSIWRDKTFAEVEKYLGLTAKGRTQYKTPAGPPEATKIDYSGMPKADYITDPYTNFIRNATWNQVPLHGTPMQKTATGNTPFDYRYPNEPTTGVQVARTQYTTPSADMPSRAGGMPRDFTLGTGGTFGGQVSAQIQAESNAIDKINSDLIKQNDILDKGISKSAQQIANDWQDIGGYISEADKEQSMFWKNLESMGLYSMDKIVDKGINQMFDQLFKKQETAISAWNDYGHKTGATWDQFKTQWEASNENMSTSWKDFTIGLAEDWAKMLAKMEAEAIAKDIYGKLTGKGAVGGSLTGRGLGWLSGGGNNPEEIPGGTGGDTMSGLTFGKAIPLVSTALGLYGGYKNIQANKKRMSAIESGLESDIKAGKISPLQSQFEYWASNPLPHSDADEKIAADFAKQLGIKYEAFATGGRVERPTIALIGEREPETIIPDSKLGSISGGNTFVFNNSFPNVKQIDEVTFKQMTDRAIKQLASEGKINQAVVR